MGLSSRQENMLKFIREFVRENRYPPTIREIGEAVDIPSTSNVSYNLNMLQEKGYLVRNKMISRGLRLVEPGPLAEAIEVPLLGRIAAGSPIPIPDAEPFEGETIRLTHDILEEEEGIYALEVQGNSMIDALIDDGDIVVMKRQEKARNGELVAVWLKDEEETTLKRLYMEEGQVRLQPANPTMDPIYVDPANVDIQGKVVMVIRQL
ncbi:MAG: transcriptional repressor LexA [Candidatus Hadarchaeota archaeon]|nr:transcriptional repressor LexA [Candidatus Hadarchaeota archaeon]